MYSWNTNDTSAPGCPCFGDYDQFGADDNGIYVATDEFGVSSPAFNGAVIYAISKEQIETAATTGILPPVFAYRLTKDPFGQPYVVAPTSTPPGAKFAPNTEYFVESNSNQASDNHLLGLRPQRHVPAGQLRHRPAMYRTEVTTEGYSFPPDATQKPGPRPLGQSYQDPPGGIQADFNAEMEPTYVGGQIYAELDTGTNSGSDAVDWFILQPTLSGTDPVRHRRPSRGGGRQGHQPAVPVHRGGRQRRRIPAVLLERAAQLSEPGVHHLQLHRPDRAGDRGDARSRS